MPVSKKRKTGKPSQKRYPHKLSGETIYTVESFIRHSLAGFPFLAGASLKGSDLARGMRGLITDMLSGLAEGEERVFGDPNSSLGNFRIKHMGGGRFSLK